MAKNPEKVPPSVNVVKVPIRAGNLGKVQFEQQIFPRECKKVGADVAHVPYWGGPLTITYSIGGYGS